jgi:hypothetical protein
MSGIIGTLPANLQNGTNADASQVMADLNFIVNQVNANAVPESATSLPNVTSLSEGSTPVTVPNLIISDSNGNYSGSLTLVGSGGYQPLFRSNGGAQQFEWVNSADTLVTMFLTDTGNLTIAGTLTQSSDERLKADWAPLAPDFIERLAAVKNGTFTRISSGERSVGVAAQSLKSALPEAVLEGPDGFLSVAYGQAALAACVELARECVELAREVRRLRALIEQVE